MTSAIPLAVRWAVTAWLEGPTSRFPEIDSAWKAGLEALREVLLALAQVLKRAEMFERHSVTLEPLSVRERMSDVLARVNAASDFVSFATLFTVEEGRMGVVVTFLALLELLREGLLDLVQSESFAPIYVRVPEAQAAGQTT